ncbi:MAG: hypothetical protein C5B59_12720 [Bacteroidetes bacterium]|nr:MAG: hypothetical protein C5B59_12720 [Bacteroidota bacterium]
MNETLTFIIKFRDGNTKTFKGVVGYGFPANGSHFWLKYGLEAINKPVVGFRSKQVWFRTEEITDLEAVGTEAKQ